MQTFNQALATLYHKRLIKLDVAMQRTSNADELQNLIERGAGTNDLYGNGPKGTPGRGPKGGPGDGKPHPSPYMKGRPIGKRPS